MTNDNQVNRRRFLRSAASCAIGVVGGLAAVGTAAADRVPGQVSVRSDSNNWHYQIYTSSPAHLDKPPVEKGDEADAGDEVNDAGSGVVGNVSDGGEDTYWFPDSIVRIFAVPDGRQSNFDMVINSPAHGNYSVITAEGDDQYRYAMNYAGDAPGVSKHNAADADDTVYGSWVWGTVNGGSGDNYRVNGRLSYMRISDPAAPTSGGLRVRFSPD